MGHKPTPPRSDADALLAAVWAAPHDDLPRLVYADFIEERGQAERAEFIRLQIAREATEAVGDDVSDEAHRREEALLPIPRRDWPEPAHWPQFDKYEAGGYFLRGFPAPVVAMTASAAGRCPAGSQRVWASWAKPGGLATLLRSCGVRGASELRLTPSAPWKPGDLAELAGPDVPQFARKLQLKGGADDALGGWVGELSLGGLRALSLPACRADGLPLLASSPAAARLVELDLSSVYFGPGELLDFSRSAVFPRLRALRLNVYSCADHDTAPLVASPLVAGLRELAVERRAFAAGMGGPLCRVLARLPPPNLRVLRLPLDDHELTEDARRALAESPLTTQLRELHARPWHDSDGSFTSASRFKAAFGNRLRPSHLWDEVPGD